MPQPEAEALQSVRACTGRLGAAVISLIKGGNTSGPVKLVPQSSLG